MKELLTSIAMLLPCVALADDFRVVAVPYTAGPPTTINLSANDFGAELFYLKNKTKGTTETSFMLSDGGIDVTVNIVHTADGSCGRPSCPDNLLVLSVTEGFVAVPTEVTVEEGTGATILIVPEGMS